MLSSVTASSRPRLFYQVAAVAVLAAITAGCSSSRFDSKLFTGATDGAIAQTAYNQPMPPALVGSSPVSVDQPNLIAVAGLPPTVGSPVNYNPTPAGQPIAAAPAAGIQQGSVITVGAGDTLFSLARTNGVSVAAIAAANGLTQTSTLTIGQRLTIPAPGATAALGTPPAPLGVIPANQTEPQAAAAQSSGIHVVRTGETIYSIGLRYGVSPNTLAAANNIPSADLVQVGQSLVIPGTNATNVTPPAAPPANPQVAAVETNNVVTDAAPAQIAALPAAAVNADPPSLTGTSFRWPVRGRVISDFGPKPGGERNDGINLSVPMGTEIHAAEAGVVIYAGNGIAGYGNLILVEHAENWVTAYAHTSEILVQRDDVIQRGQVIALAGNTGSVTASQLHFELRRGTVPVNPLDYLTD